MDKKKKEENPAKRVLAGPAFRALPYVFHIAQTRSLMFFLKVETLFFLQLRLNPQTGKRRGRATGPRQVGHVNGVAAPTPSAPGLSRCGHQPGWIQGVLPTAVRS